MFRIKDLWSILKDTGYGFNRHKAFTLSASLSFYTILTLGPMLLIIIFISNIFWGRQAIEGTIHNQISGLVGDAAAIEIQELIKNASMVSNDSMAFIGIGMLLFFSTTFFNEMQNSMNTIWNIQVKKTRNWQQILKNRVLSFSIVAGLGFLMLVFLIINGLLEGFMSKIQELFPQKAVSLIYAINLLVTLLVVTLLFAFIFKVLPDAVIKYKDVAAGALFTSVLFMIGKFGVSLYIDFRNMESAYDSTGALMVLLLWIYYSATILFFGAEFTKTYALKYGSEIKPKDYAVTIKIIKVESNPGTVQQNEKIQGKQ